MRDRSPSAALHALAPHAAAVAFGAVVGMLALPLAPAARHRVGPATLSASAALGAGGTVLRVPPLGTVAAPTHRSPLTLGLLLTQVDFAALGERVTTDEGQGELIAQIEVDLRDLAQRAALQAVAAAAVLGAVACALLPRRRWPYVVGGAAGGAIAAAAAMAAIATTYDVDAFKEPRFTGALTRAPVVLDALQGGDISLSDITSRYENAADRLSELLLLLAEPDVDPRAEALAVLHISDIHSNPLGLEIANQLATRFEADLVVDTGDIMSYGLPVETRIGRWVERIQVPYVYVPGNHDSAPARAALARLDNVTVVDRQPLQMLGITFLGWPDPTYTNRNLMDPDQAAEVRATVARLVAEKAAEHRPDVLLVHDPRLASRSYGEVPLILAGHNHKRANEEIDGTRLLGVGSTGATGIKSFTVDEDQNYEAEIVYFVDDRAVAVDYVTFSGLGSDFEVQRTTFERGST